MTLGVSSIIINDRSHHVLPMPRCWTSPNRSMARAHGRVSLMSLILRQYNYVRSIAYFKKLR